MLDKYVEDPSDQLALQRIAGFAYDSEDLFQIKAIKISYIM